MKLYFSFKRFLFKYCFLVVTIFISTLFIEFSIDLPSVALFLSLAFCFLILLPSFSALLSKSILRSTHGFQNGSCLTSKILLIFFFFAVINLNKVSRFDSGVCIFFYCLNWEKVFCFYQKKNYYLL